MILRRNEYSCTNPKGVCAGGIEDNCLEGDGLEKCDYLEPRWDVCAYPKCLKEGINFIHNQYWCLEHALKSRPTAKIETNEKRYISVCGKEEMTLEEAMADAKNSASASGIYVVYEVKKIGWAEKNPRPSVEWHKE